MGCKAPCGEVPVLEAHSSCLKEDRKAGVEERLEESVERWSLGMKLSRDLRDIVPFRKKELALRTHESCHSSEGLFLGLRVGRD